MRNISHIIIESTWMDTNALHVNQLQKCLPTKTKILTIENCLNQMWYNTSVAVACVLFMGMQLSGVVTNCHNKVHYNAQEDVISDGICNARLHAHRIELQLLGR